MVSILAIRVGGGQRKKNSVGSESAEHKAP